jgi:hypothetical protein
MRLKLGNSNAVVAPALSPLGNEEAVMRTFVKGYRFGSMSAFRISKEHRTGKQTYIKSGTALSNHAFEPSHKLTSRALFLLDITDPVLLPCAEYDLFRVRRHGVQ